MYRSDTELESAVRAFLSDAAAAAEPVLVALPGDDLEQVRSAAGGVGADVRFEDMCEVGRNPNRILPLIEEWVSEQGGRGRVRVLSQTIWPGRSYAETVEALRHAALVNQALADSEATILCAYDAEHLDADTLAGAELTHPVVIEDGERRPSRFYGGRVTRDVVERWPLEPPSEPMNEHDLGVSLSDLRHAVADDPLLSSLSGQQRDDLVLAVNEAATNAIKHGDGMCTTRIWHDGNSIVTEISTHTQVADPLAGRHPKPGADAVSGWGLWLINEVCDLVEMRTASSGTTLRMHMSDG